ncbi:hypothetical protein B0H15DRAFT_993974 [Mycena belliarum]|uniref:Uncharacterized protein n=1 Tax=Mycena belliarum TaxID=1033014 RepID=A0AAD6TYS8_9AGAR|nr:hypothetical protein B0H15DRAFT_993974 [Mycena belliae]
MRLSASLFAAAIRAAVASNVLKLKPDNWDTTRWSAVLNGLNLAPVYEQLADTYVHVKDKFILAKVDADGEGKPLGSEYDITSFSMIFTVPDARGVHRVPRRLEGVAKTLMLGLPHTFASASAALSVPAKTFSAAGGSAIYVGNG